MAPTSWTATTLVFMLIAVTVVGALRHGVTLNTSAMIGVDISSAPLLKKTLSLESISLHVDPVGGNDAFNGTVAWPFASLRAAQLELRQRSRPQLDTAEVWLHGGTHQVPKGGLRLVAEDSNVIYRAAEPNVFVSGGQSIGGWERNGSSMLWRAPLGPANRTRQLYAFGTRAQRASTAWRTEWTHHLDRLTPTGFLFRPGLPLEGWLDVEQLEFVWTGTTSVWTESRCGVEALIRMGNGSLEVTMKEPCWTNGVKKQQHQNIHSPPTSVENSRSLLGGPGEWVHGADGFLYYWPRQGEDMANNPDISIPVEEVLLGIDGSHHVEWHGVTFEQSSWLYPSSGMGYIEIQSGWLVGEAGTPGAIRVSAGRSLAFVGCTFRHLGASGLQVANGSQQVNATSCVFDDISGHGLVLGQIDDGTETSNAQQNAEFLVENNTIRRTPAEFHGCNGIWGGYMRSVSIRHNDIRNCACSGQHMLPLSLALCVCVCACGGCCKYTF